MGVTKIVSLQAFLAYPADLPEEIPVGILRGMNDFMHKLGASVTGGQTIKNPEPVFGGIALGVAHPNDVVYSHGAKPGDVVLLTKPLGIQSAMRSYRDLLDDKRDALLESFSESELARMQDVAVRIMTKSNLEVAEAMRIVKAHAATDITGFGILGHASNVAALSCVDVVLDTIPVIRGTLELAEFFGHKLSEGFGAETAGGMLVFVEPKKVNNFIEFLSERNLPCWTLGHTIKPVNDPSAYFAKDTEFIETEFP
ncbi:MAG: selenide, water dikinase SelD, partial [Candidatus Thorarchaeota archaeon]